MAASPFLSNPAQAAADTLAIIHVSRDNLLPVQLKQPTGAVDGYAEGDVFHTRFGSFPHSTIIGKPWGSQIRASRVDTGARGRKRKRDGHNAGAVANEDSASSTPAKVDDDDEGAVKTAVEAASGFVHVLKPTPELWTYALPHRTQVVYTPDYSYILQRIRAVPGTTLIEAGSGSGSFTHASARAVFSGYPTAEGDSRGKVFSFEVDERRFRLMEDELRSHRLEGIVQITHRDVYENGFLVDGKSPKATAIFLDVPGPWKALPHLSRRKPGDQDPEWISPLDPEQAVHICTFSPCIEQVTQTISCLRDLGWVDIDMVEIAQRRINTMRDRYSIKTGPEGEAAQARDVDESISRLRAQTLQSQVHIARMQARLARKQKGGDEGMDVDEEEENAGESGEKTKPGRSAKMGSKAYKYGKVMSRSEADIKTHTSYLVFATMPREWSAEDEEAALAKWPVSGDGELVGDFDKATRKIRKAQMHDKGGRKAKRRA